MTQSIILLLYNLFLTAVYAIAGVCAYFFYAQKKDSYFIALGVMFCAYIFDNTIVCCTELIPEFATLYDTLFLLAPSVKTIYFIILVGCMLYAFQKSMNILSLVRMLIPMAIYSIILISAPIINENNWMVFIYYLPTQLMMVVIALWGLRRIKKYPDFHCQDDLAVNSKMLVILMLFGLGILIEDTIVIFSFDIFAAVGLKINNRNFTENLLFLTLAFYIIRKAQSGLKTCLNDVSQFHSSSSMHIVLTPFKQFCTSYALTEREGEILECLLNGKSQQEISEELIIALGTVKTHTHNVYQKTNASNRTQLLHMYKNFAERTKMNAQ
ncbi:MAG: helix-turn-helix transcriptional regulator [Oscillospiraceae bacterium]|nr:helix-turn-helix transcriptional regulator [Oscillospiraceae bacterium]